MKIHMMAVFEKSFSHMLIFFSSGHFSVHNTHARMHQHLNLKGFKNCTLLQCSSSVEF